MNLNYQVNREKSKCLCILISIFISIFLFGACSDNSINSPEPSLWEFDHHGEHTGEHTALGESVNYSFITRANADFLVENENQITIEGSGTFLGSQSSLLVGQINEDPPEVTCVHYPNILEAEFTFGLIGKVVNGILELSTSNINFGANNIDGCFGKALEIAGYEILLELMFNTSIEFNSNTKINGEFQISQPIELDDQEVGWRTDSHIWENSIYDHGALVPLVPIH